MPRWRRCSRSGVQGVVFGGMRCLGEEDEGMAGLAVQRAPAAQLASPEGRRVQSAVVLGVPLVLPWAEKAAGRPSVQTLAQTQVRQTRTVQANVRVQVMIP